MFLSEYDKYFYQRTKWRENIAKDCKQITTFKLNKKYFYDEIRFIKQRNFKAF